MFGGGEDREVGEGPRVAARGGIWENGREGGWIEGSMLVPEEEELDISYIIL
jgi:hypothetical protein